MKTNTPILGKIGIASIIMMGSVLASRVIGVVREMVIAGSGGIRAEVDAYQVAFIIPEILNHVTASGFLSITVIPIFAGYLSQGRKEEGYRVFSIIMTTFGSLLLGFILLSVFLAEPLVRLLAPGIQDPDTLILAVRMTRIIIPAQFFFFTGGLFMAVQFAQEKFFMPALAPLIYNLSIILGGICLGPSMGMEGFAWGVLIGAFVGNFAVQFLAARKLGARYTFCLNFSHPDLLLYIKMTLPLMIGLTMTFSTEILLKFFGSYLSEGSIAAMNYALRIMFILVGLFGQAIGVASYPFMARLAGEGKMADLNHLLNTTLSYIFLVIPFSAVFMVLSRETVVLLFQRGQFDRTATLITAGILPYFMAGAFAFSAQNIVSRGYYAVRNTLFPSIFTSLCVLVGLPLIFALMHFMGPRGVALGLSLSVILQAFVLFECWSRKSGNSGKKKVYGALGRMCVLGLVLGSVLRGLVLFLRQFLDSFSFLGALTISAATGTAFLILFFGAGHVLAIPEITRFYEKFCQRRPSWMKKSLAWRKK